MATSELASAARVVACCALTVVSFWFFAILGIICGGSTRCERVWDAFWLVLSPLFAYLTVYKPKIAFAYVVAVGMAVVLLMVEAAAAARLGKADALSSAYVFWPCLAANFAFGVWLTRGRHRWTLAK
jgi:hypothetical protein